MLTLEKINLLGACVTLLFYLSTMLVFILRLSAKPRFEYWLGLIELGLGFPMLYLLIKAPAYHRPALYYIQLALMLAWLAVEFVLDYLLKIDFRRSRRAVIAYVTLFFAGTGGMLGIASCAGRAWTVVSAALFIIMAVLAFVQRSVTGK